MFFITDHRTILSFVCSFFKINLQFKKNYHREFFFDKKQLHKFYISGFLVSPNCFNVYRLLYVAKAAKIFTASNQNELEHYVTFTRASFHRIIKTWCDWCAIANGYMAFLIDGINEYYERHPLDSIKRNNIHLIKLKILASSAHTLKFMIKKDILLLKKTPNQTAADLFPKIHQDAPQHIQKLLELITQFYNTVQEIEYVWCPFEYMQRIAIVASNDDKLRTHFLKCDSFDDVIRAGELLFNFKHIKCHDCIKLLNEHLDSEAEPITQTIAADYFKLMCQLTR
jgi:hypothetical protein